MEGRIIKYVYLELSTAQRNTSHEYNLPFDEIASSVSLARIHKQSYQPSARLHVVRWIKRQAPETFELTANMRFVSNVYLLAWG